MIIREVTYMENNGQTVHKIIGFSTINHNVRVRMELSLEDYVLMDYIYSHNQIDNKPITFGKYYNHTGFIYEEIEFLFVRLKKRNLLVWDEKHKRVDVCEEWYDIFSSDKIFNELWKIHPKGNKLVAKGCLPKALKKIPFDKLKEKLIAYVSSVEEFKYRKDLSSWLNPLKENWNNPLVLSETAPKNLQVKFKKWN